MKIQNIHFLAKANLKGNKKTTAVFVTMIILVVSLTFVSSFSYTIQKNVNTYKSNVAARTFYITPFQHKLDEQTIENISKINHIESVFPQLGLREQGYYWTGVSDSVDIQQKIDNDEARISLWTLVGNENKNVVSGKTLDKSPAYSCLVPDSFYPFDLPEGMVQYNSNLDFLDGKSLVGKKLTLYTKAYEFWRCNDINLGEDFEYLDEMEIELEVAGVYHLEPTSEGYSNMLLISEKTGKLIEEKAIIDYYGEIPEWRTDLSMRDYYIIVDDYDNIDYVRNELAEMNIDYAPYSELGMSDTVFIISNLLTVLSVLLVLSTVILNIINIMQSTVNSIMSRKGEIGLLKAVGYKNGRIFATLYYEQSMLTLKGVLTGGIISALAVFIINFMNVRISLYNELYVIDWNNFFMFFAISVIIAVVVPLICQLICLKKLNKIQPYDAMIS